MAEVVIDAQKLVDAAKSAAGNAHGIYSKTSRGAALVSEDGSVFVGVNVEFATYNGSICAEMAALAAAVTAGRSKFVAIALYPYGFPCGGCRQGLSEFGTNLKVLSRKPDGVLESVSLAQLLPETFGKEHLG